tara:strand:- start:9472 stop:9957 length:486 start_codon:yes stop_codon:yes gene_type:complete
MRLALMVASRQLRRDQRESRENGFGSNDKDFPKAREELEEAIGQLRGNPEAKRLLPKARAHLVANEEREKEIDDSSFGIFKDFLIQSISTGLVLDDDGNPKNSALKEEDLMDDELPMLLEKLESYLKAKTHPEVVQLLVHILSAIRADLTGDNFTHIPPID